jgi:hypothetical protein
MCISVLCCSCGGDANDALQSDPALHPLLERTLQQALRDSAALAQGQFQADAVMSMALRQDAEEVQVIDSLSLAKDSTGYTADQHSHQVQGDTSLLKNMYAFEDAKGAPRAGERAHLASLDFGTSFPTLLRSLLAAEEGSGYELTVADTLLADKTCSCIRYRMSEKEGTFCVDTGMASLVRLEVQQESNYGVGSYDYHALIDFRRIEDLLLPILTNSTFQYRRVLTRGTGSIGVMLRDIRIRKDSVEIPKQ